MTWRRSIAVTGAFFRDFPQQPHLFGRCFTFLSGWSVTPSWSRAGLSGLRACARTCRAATSGPAWPGRPMTAASELREFVFTWAARSATCDCSTARASRSAAFSAAAPRSARPARPAVPGAACSQRKGRHHRYRERRASRARTNAATTPPHPQIGRHRSGHSRRESGGDERESQTELSSLAYAWVLKTLWGGLRASHGPACAGALTRSSITCQTSLSSWFSFQMPYAVPSSTGGTATSPIAPLTAASTHSWPPGRWSADPPRG